jgi:hypothetical protein
MDEESDTEPLPLNCPYCGLPLFAQRRGEDKPIIYRCATHGHFWIDPSDGRFRELPSTPH